MATIVPKEFVCSAPAKRSDDGALDVRQPQFGYTRFFSLIPLGKAGDQALREEGFLSHVFGERRMAFKDKGHQSGRRLSRPSPQPSPRGEGKKSPGLSDIKPVSRDLVSEVLIQ